MCFLEIQNFFKSSKLSEINFKKSHAIKYVHFLSYKTLDVQTKYLKIKKKIKIKILYFQLLFAIQVLISVMYFPFQPFLLEQDPNWGATLCNHQVLI